MYLKGQKLEVTLHSLHSDCKNVQKSALKSVNVQRTGKSILQMFAFSFLYPFGESLFIGIVKFFDSTKGFGYIASNNYGMESHKRFNSSEQGFYIDNSSWEQSVPEKKAVVFRPAIKDGKLRAEDVRAVNLATDREIVMNYYEHNNFIQYEEKVKRFSTGRYGRTHFEGYSHERRKFNILMKSGISRYELLNEYATSFAETNDFDYLIKKIDKIVETIDGDNAYNKQLRGSYGNKENEHAALVSTKND